MKKVRERQAGGSGYLWCKLTACTGIALHALGLLMINPQNEGTGAMMILSGGIVIVLGIIMLAVKSLSVGSLVAESRGVAQSTSRTQRLKKAPGFNLLILVEYFYAPKIVEEVFRQIVADWRIEYFDALQECKRWKARCIWMRYIVKFGMAMGLSKVISFVKSVASR